MSPEHSPEHQVAMDVVTLLSVVTALWVDTRNPKTHPYIIRDYEQIADAHAELGKIVNAISPKQLVAAE